MYRGWHLKQKTELIFSILNQLHYDGTLPNEAYARIVRLEVLSDIMFVPSSFAAHLVQGRRTILKEQA